MRARVNRAAAGLVVCVLTGCGDGKGGVRLPAPEVFRDTAEAAGLDFTHFNGMSGELYLAEIMGPGGAFFDYDNDGDLDVYLVQGNMLGPDRTFDDALFPPVCSLPPRDRLFRNDLAVGDGGQRTLRFVDVTDASKLDAQGYGMGAAAGDFNNDGQVDLYVTNFGSNQLFRNNGDGTFTDVTEAAGVDDSRFTTAAAFLDFDRDGWLDLFVGNYVDFSFRTHRTAFRGGVRNYAGPKSYDPLPNRLFHNRGDGTFQDVTVAAGIAAEFGGALGVLGADLNADGWVDIYVANDARPNQLWINQRDGSFQNQADFAACAVNAEGKAEGSMGIDAGDFDGDGDDDLFLTNFENQTNTLYVNIGQGLFEDRTARCGLGKPSYVYTGFGTAWFDYDNDGWLDLLVANGAVGVLAALRQAGDPFPLHQPNQLFRNLGNGRFEERSARAGSVFELSEVSRGAAFGDVDNDGDTDVLVVNNNGPVRLLINQAGDRWHWLGLRLVGGRPARDMPGARVAIRLADGRTLWRRVRADGSYCVANDPRVLVGLGDATSVERVRVWWPNGQSEEWTGLPVDAYTTLREGTGSGVASTHTSKPQGASARAGDRSSFAYGS